VAVSVYSAENITWTYMSGSDSGFIICTLHHNLVDQMKDGCNGKDMYHVWGKSEMHTTLQTDNLKGDPGIGGI
jgi:hypothetical protein